MFGGPWLVVLHRVHALWNLMNLCCVRTLVLSVSSSLWFSEVAFFFIIYALRVHPYKPKLCLIKKSHDKESLTGFTVKNLCSQTPSNILQIHLPANLYSCRTYRWNHATNYFHKLAKELNVLSSCLINLTFL